MPPRIFSRFWQKVITKNVPHSFIGQYADEHGIVGNAFYNPKNGKVFDIDQIGTENDTTGDSDWWKEVMPIWTTALKSGEKIRIKKLYDDTKYYILGIRTTMYYMSRCDVPIEGLAPEKCIPYNTMDPVTKSNFVESLDSACEDLKNGIDFSVVYTDMMDHVGHMHGPDSPKVIK